MPTASIAARNSHHNRIKRRRRRPRVPTSKELIHARIESLATGNFDKALTIYPLSGVNTFNCTAKNFRLVGTAIQTSAGETTSTFRNYFWVLKVIKEDQDSPALNMGAADTPVEGSLPESNTFMFGCSAIGASFNASGPTLGFYTVNHWDVSSKTRRKLAIGDSIIMGLKALSAAQVIMNSLIQYWIEM
jgi:hypothetical protein